MSVKYGPGYFSKYNVPLWACAVQESNPGMETGFSAPVQTDRKVHPASFTMAPGYFLGVERPERASDHPPSSSAEIKWRLELYLYYLSGPFCPFVGWILLLPLRTVLNFCTVPNLCRTVTLKFEAAR